MENEKRYRYPGINSFEITDTDIFFGREEDRRKLADLVEVEKNVLLYSRSGLGKSSLLKAGLIPELIVRGYQPYYIRLGVYQENSLPPVQTVLRKTIFIDQLQLPVTFLHKFINYSNSLWYVFKSLQISDIKNEKPIVLIFDQFEEIGSYSDGHILNFKQQVAELLSATIPQSYLEALDNNNLVTQPFTDDELALLYKPLRAKLVFAVRFDQIGVMNKLRDYLPNIQNIYYDLKPLSTKQAENAITKPANETGNFFTPPFDYRKDAIQKILGSLDPKEKNEIDTAQLQILLQYIEQDIVEEKNNTDINAENLGDLNKVYEDYYHNSLIKLKGEQEQAQVLIEDKLIIEGRRIQYDKALCEQLVSEETLNSLIETRLLRQESNTMGGYSYEVSHDSLVAPILQTREERKRKEEEANQIAEFEKKLNEQRKKQKQQRFVLYIALAAVVISSIFCAWAIIERNYANTASNQAKQTLQQVEIQKDSTQMVLNNFIRAEIARKTLEKEQLLTKIRTYSKSNEELLIRQAQILVDSLDIEIKSLGNQPNK